MNKQTSPLATPERTESYGSGRDQTPTPTATRLAPDKVETRRAGRLLYIDNLKIVLVAGVIMAHAATRYVGGGTWTTGTGSGPTGFVVLVGVLGLLGGLFWLGLFFLIAGMLAPASIAHHGPADFMRDRLRRLGVPLVVYVLLVMPVLDYWMYAATFAGKGNPVPPWTWIARFWVPNPGPMWFVTVLLVFSAAYAAWYLLHPSSADRSTPLRGRHLLGLAAVITVTSFAAHLVWPLSSRQFMDLHLWQWPQYFFLFSFGIISAKRHWLVALPDRLWRWCGLAVIGAALAFPVSALAGGALSGQLAAFGGGWHWQALIVTAIEGALAVGGTLWLLEYFRRHFDRQGPWARDLGRSAYAAFVVHTPVIVSLWLGLRWVDLPIELKFLLLAVGGIVISFAAGWILVVRLRLARGIL